MRLWEAQEGTQTQLFKIGPILGNVHQVAFAPDDRHLATANGNGTIYILRLAPPPKTDEPK